MGTSSVQLHRFLHPKTGASYPRGNDLVVAGELAANGACEGFGRIAVPPEEECCANCIRVNDHDIVPAGYERPGETIAERAYSVIELEMSEFRRVAGGLSCLSLRLE